MAVEKINVSAQKLIGWGYDVDTLRRCLELALSDCSEKSLSHFATVRDFDHSIRVFGQHPFENSVSLLRQISPEGLAKELIRLAETEARYSRKLDPSKIKGWAIYTEITGNYEFLVTARAVWVDQN